MIFRDVVLGAGERDAKALSYLLVAEAFAQERQHFLLSGREEVGVGRAAAAFHVD